LLLCCTNAHQARQRILWLRFFLSFTVKVPTIPFHIWLPEAHVEASLAVSINLAGILLKLAGYGFLRYSI
jgi:NADH:ubiquinone oxidoreductase subunit 4 (subunit M)